MIKKYVYNIVDGKTGSILIQFENNTQIIFNVGENLYPEHEYKNKNSCVITSIAHSITKVDGLFFGKCNWLITLVLLDEKQTYHAQ